MRPIAGPDFGHPNGEVPFVVGARRGFRGWRLGLVRPDGLVAGWKNGWEDAAQDDPRLEHHRVRLVSVSYLFEWTPGVNTSVCQNLRPVPACVYPTTRCTCGFYAYHDEEYWPGSSSICPTIHGVIEAWGHMVMGTKGFRAAKAVVTGLGASVYWPKPWHGTTSPGTLRTMEQAVIEQLRERYPSVWLAPSDKALLERLPLQGSPW